MRAVLFLLAFSSLVGCGRPSAPTRPQAERPVVSAPGSADVPPRPAPGVLPPIPFPPGNWTHKELAEYLRSKGLNVVVEPVPQYSTDGKVAAGFYEETTRGETLSMALVYACRDPQAAADQAGALGDGALTCGRFAIGLFPKPDNKKADLDYLRRISKALN